MVDVGFGGAAHGGSFSAGTLYSDGIGLASGRSMAPDGNTSVLVTALAAYLGGHSGSPVGSLSLISVASTGSFALPNIGAPGSGNSPLVGPYGAGPGFIDGGSTRFQWNGPSSGPAYPGRGGGGTVNGPAGFSRAGTLGGLYRFVQAPVAPTMVSVTSSLDGTAADIVFSWGGDDGGSGITGYTLQRADDAGFSVNVATIAVTGGSNTVTGLTSGKKYFWRATAKNQCTNSAGRLGGPWSGTIATTQALPAIGRLNATGSDWTGLLDGKVNPTGASWVKVDAKVNPDGSGWVDSGS